MRRNKLMVKTYVRIPQNAVSYIILKVTYLEEKKKKT